MKQISESFETILDIEKTAHSDTDVYALQSLQKLLISRKKYCKIFIENKNRVNENFEKYHIDMFNYHNQQILYLLGIKL